MTPKKLICSGSTGACVSAVCCLTPALTLLLGGTAFGTWLGFSDYVLIPAFLMFSTLTIIGVTRLRRNKRA